MNKDNARNSIKNEKAIADLYWLAFLLTGSQDISIDIAVDAAPCEDLERPFFGDWMRGWYRRLVIVKALAAIHHDLSESAHRTKTARLTTRKVPRSWSLGPDVTKEDLDRALLAIGERRRPFGSFSARGSSSTRLRRHKPDVLKRAQAIGLSELTDNLAETKAPTGAFVHR